MTFSKIVPTVLKCGGLAVCSLWQSSCEWIVVYNSTSSAYNFILDVNYKELYILWLFLLVKLSYFYLWNHLHSIKKHVVTFFCLQLAARLKLQFQRTRNPLWKFLDPPLCNSFPFLTRWLSGNLLRGHLQTDFRTLNVIMTLRGEGGSAHDVINFY